MRLNSNKQLSDSLSFISAIRELHLHLLINTNIASWNLHIEEPDKFIIKEIESQQEFVEQDDPLSEHDSLPDSFERFTDEENSEEESVVIRGTNIEPGPRIPILQSQEIDEENLRQTAHFSNEGDSEMSNEKLNRQSTLITSNLSIKDRLMAKLLQQKEKLSGGASRHSANGSFSQQSSLSQTINLCTEPVHTEQNTCMNLMPNDVEPSRLKINHVTVVTHYPTQQPRKSTLEKETPKTKFNRIVQLNKTTKLR